MRLLSFLLTLLFSINTFASGLSAPFSGSRLSGLTRGSTIFESDSTVDHSGNLIDQSGSNYFTYSSQFDNAAWTKYPASASVTADNEPCPVGTNAAELFNEGTVNDSHSLQMQPTVATGSYVLSVYIKYKAAGRAWAYLRNAGAANKNAWFNVQNGTVGTVESLISAYNITSVGSGWYRISIETTDTAPGSTWAIRAASADNTTAHLGDGRGAFWVCGAQLSKNDANRKGPGVYHQTVAANKPLLDLSPTATPTESTSYLQGADGRRLKARTFNGTTQYYSKAHDASMNVFDTDHTLTFVFKANSTGAGTEDVLFNHGASNVDGIVVEVADTNFVGFCYYKGGASVCRYNTTSIRDNLWHVGQIVRSSDIASLFVDGVKISSTSIATYGIDGSKIMYLAAYAGGLITFDGSILYTRIDTEALSDTQLAAEREIIQGTLFGSGNLNPGSTFTRTTTATQTYSDGTVGYVAAGVPRVSGDGGGVLVEEQRSNILTYSQNQANAAWAVTNITNPPVAYTGVDPTGATSAYILAEDGTAAANHKLSRNGWVIVATSTTYTFSAFVKAINRNWVALMIWENAGSAAYTWFNVSAGIVSATMGSTTNTITPYANGWYRCSVTRTITGGITQVDTSVYIADADGSDTFNGLTQDSLAVFGEQLEVGAHATSYIPTTSAAITRTADSLTIEPWKLTKPSAGTPNFAMYFDNDVYNTGTYTSEVGNYTFTVNGDTKHIESQTLGDYFSFDGSSDYLSYAGAGFSPSGSFSVTAVVTPSTVAVGEGPIIVNDAPPTSRCWNLYRSGSDVAMQIYKDNVTFTIVTKATCLVANKTSLVTATYTYVADTTSIVNIYVDNLAVATNLTVRGPPQAAVTQTAIGAYAGGFAGLSWNGKIHHVTYHDGVVLSQAQHDAMYANLKQANILPVKIGTSYENKKLYVEFDAKCEFSSISIDSISLFEISGNTGSADVDTNRIVFRIGAAGNVYFMLYADGESTERQMNISTPLTDLDKWHTYKATFDLSELGNSTAYRDSTLYDSVTSMSGAKNLDFTNTNIRIGQGYTGTTYRGCSYRNLKIRSTP